MALPALGELSYNGYEFPSNVETVGVEIKPMYDQAGRTVTHSVYKFQFRWWVTNDTEADQGEDLEDIRAKLERPGKAFVFEGRGFGTFNIGGDGAKDLAWGPKPGAMSWRPRGRGLGAELTWSIEFARIGCPDAPDSGRVMELNYKSTITIDRLGYTTRSVTGYYRIPMTRQVAGNVIPDHADRYWEQICPPVPAGFRRAQLSRTFDESKAKCEFSYTEEQIAEPLPIGVAEIDGDHSHTTTPRSFVTWSSTISASITLTPGRPKGDAWRVFLDLVRERVAAERLRNPKAVTVPMSVSISEPIGSRVAGRFEVAYRHVIDVPARRGIPVRIPWGGIWRRLPNSNPIQWDNSMREGPHGPRGQAGMREDMEAIVDLCMSSDTRIDQVLGGAQPRINPQQLAEFQELARAMGIANGVPSPQSWLAYESAFRIETMDHIIEHKPLPFGPISPGLPAAQLQGAAFGFGAPFSPPPIVQVRTSPSYYVRWTGRALRLGYTIEQPRVLRAGNWPCTPANSPEAGCFWREDVVGHTFTPIYGATWSLRWLVVPNAGSAGLIPSPSNPPAL